MGLFGSAIQHTIFSVESYLKQKQKIKNILQLPITGLGCSLSNLMITIFLKNLLNFWRLYISRHLAIAGWHHVVLHNVFSRACHTVDRRLATRYQESLHCLSIL